MLYEIFLKKSCSWVDIRRLHEPCGSPRYNRDNQEKTAVSSGFRYVELLRLILQSLGNKCILQLRGVRPFYSDKFDITKHKRYKQLSDYDKKNEFHVEEYMKHQMEVRLDPEEQFDLYMYESSELEEQSNNENEGTGHVT